MTLQPRDMLLLDALRQDRAESGPGLTSAQMQNAAATVWVGWSLDRLKAAGHTIASVGRGDDERWQLLDPDFDAERADGSSVTPTHLTEEMVRILRAARDGRLYSVSGYWTIDGEERPKTPDRELLISRGLLERPSVSHSLRFNRGGVFGRPTQIGQQELRDYEAQEAS